MMLRGVLLLLLLTACSAVAPVKLSAPQQLAASVQVSQLVSVPRAGGPLRFSVVWSQHRGEFTLVGLSLVGQTLFRLNHRADELSITRYQREIPEQLVRELVQQIQHAYWPVHDVQETLAAHWQLREGADASSRWRRYYYRERLQTEYRYQGNDRFAGVQIRPRGGETLIVQTLSVQPIPDGDAPTLRGTSENP